MTDNVTTDNLTNANTYHTPGVRFMFSMAMMLLSSCLSLSFPQRLFGADFTVTKTEDTADGLCNADCSLREAIIAANADPALDRIVLGSFIYTLTIPANGQEENESLVGDLDITADLEIVGEGAGKTIIDGAGFPEAGRDRLLHVLGSDEVTPTVVISGVTIAHGYLSGYQQNGGGIYAYDADLTLQDVQLQDNSAFAGGGFYGWQSRVTLKDSVVRRNTTVEDGGGIMLSINTIYRVSSLTLINSVIEQNRARNGGGIESFATTTVIRQSKLNGNIATCHQGGGIDFVAGDNELLITDSEIISNVVLGEGCEGQGYVGGGILFTGSRLEIVNSEILSNSADSGGGLYISSLSGVGVAKVLSSTVGYNRAQKPSNIPGGYGGGIITNGELNIVNSRLISNTADSDGGGISGRGVIISSTIAYNQAVGDGGGIFGTVSLTNSVLSHNKAKNGGAYAVNVMAEESYIVNSTLHDNQASEDGGGIFIAWAARTPAGKHLPTVVIQNSTVTNNSAKRGGGFSDLKGSGTSASGNPLAAETTILNSTISHNAARSEGGGIYHVNGAILTIENSLMVNNGLTGDCAGADYTSSGYNLISDNTCANGGANAPRKDLINLDPQLGPLQTVDGSTPMRIIPITSPARNVGNLRTCTKTDQRGIFRPQESGCDIGAYEYLPIGLYIDTIALNYRVLKGQNPPPQYIEIRNAGDTPAAWTADESIPWLTLSAAQGNTPSTLVATVESSNLAPGGYSGQVIIQGTMPGDAPKVVTVTVAVNDQTVGEIFRLSGGVIANLDKTVVLTFPANAVARTTLVTITTLGMPTAPNPSYVFAGRAFDLVASDLDGNPVSRFTQPYTLTVWYSDTDLQNAGISDENTVKLFVWLPNEFHWLEVPPCQRCGQNSADNTIFIVDNHFTEFALFGESSETPNPTQTPTPGQRIYLPTVQK